MDKLTFYRGVLFALRSHTKEFEAYGDRFHSAFAEMVRFALDLDPELVPKDLMLERDPVFGVYPEAGELLLEGEQDLVLALLNPRHHRAMFKIGTAEATLELEELPHADEFRKLGKKFHEELRR